MDSLGVSLSSNDSEEKPSRCVCLSQCRMHSPLWAHETSSWAHDQDVCDDRVLPACALVHKRGLLGGAHGRNKPFCSSRYTWQDPILPADGATAVSENNDGNTQFFFATFMPCNCLHCCRLHRSLGFIGVPPAQALLDGQLGFGFSAGGLLFPYYVGIIMALRDELGVLLDSTPVAGRG